jgi:hypothetical protein
MLVAIAHIVVFLAGLAAAVTLPHGAPYVTPFAPAEQVRLFFSQNQTAVRISNFFLFGSAVPFGIFVATAISRLRFYGVRAAGTNIALFCGMSAAFALFLSGMTGWILSTSGMADSASLAQALYYLSFLAGGAPSIRSRSGFWQRGSPLQATSTGCFRGGSSFSECWLRSRESFLPSAWLRSQQTFSFPSRDTSAFCG